MASFEGKDITIQHPDEFVGPDNYQELTHGVMFNIRKGSEQIEVDDEMVDPLLGDFLIKSSEAIELVKAGEREVSLGYEAAWELISDEEGRHSKIRGNHCAIVSEGRAGNYCAITDHKKENELMGKEALEKFKKLHGKTVDEAIKEKEAEIAAKAKDSTLAAKFKKLFGKSVDEAIEEKEKKSEDEEEEKEKEEKPKPKKKEESEDESEEEQSKEDEKMKGLSSRLDKVEGMLEKLLEKLSASDESEDEESEESEDEDESEVVSEDEESEDEMCEDEGSEEEKKPKANDTLSRAEILAPGIKKSKDIMSKALAKAYKTADGKKVIDALTGGKNPSTLPKTGVQAVFVAAAEMMKTKRVADHASQRITTIDSFPALKGTAVKTPQEINEMNAKFYNKK